ncbi:MAG TPA: metallophosphoesterase, partial [Solirubrobacterales bacterium]|nr:metallophosphoesterase [Solirubrobacterales bacterium]
MRTAILSDLHLGVASGEDVLREPEIRRLLLAELAGADRVVLLGDVVELRDLALGAALDSARPFFEELGEVLGEREVTIVPGNHDHRLAEPLLDRLSLAGATELGLEQHDDPGTAGAAATIASWLGPVGLRISYPGLWLRDDVYATHGHYMDAHLTLPRTECLAVAALIRATGPLPRPASPSHYERVLRPIYGFSFGIAQARARVSRPPTQPSAAAWKLLSGNQGGGAARRKRLTASALRTAFPAGVWALNRLLHSDFDADISADAIFTAGVAAGTEMSARLQVDGVQVITGHTHRAGPNEDEAAWPLPGGGQLHNTGSWVFASAFHTPGAPPNAYWPGTVTWLEDDKPPRRVRLLDQHSHAEMTGVIKQTARRRAQ